MAHLSKSKRILAALALTIGVLLNSACPVKLARSEDTFTNALLYISRIDKAVDTFSEVSFQLYCPDCEQHALPKAVALQHQNIAAQINKYEQVAFGVLRSAYDPATRKFSLTAANRAGIESALQAIKALTPTGTDASIPSDVSLKLQPLLSTITGSADRLLALMSRVKSAVGGSVFEVVLDARQGAELEAAINP